MATYKGREVTILRDAAPAYNPDRILIHNVELGGTEIVNKDDLIMTQEERDADLKRERANLDAREKHYNERKSNPENYPTGPVKSLNEMPSNAVKRNFDENPNNPKNKNKKVDEKNLNDQQKRDLAAKYSKWNPQVSEGKPEDNNPKGPASPIYHTSNPVV